MSKFFSILSEQDKAKFLESEDFCKFMYAFKSDNIIAGANESVEQMFESGQMDDILEPLSNGDLKDFWFVSEDFAEFLKKSGLPVLSIGDDDVCAHIWGRLENDATPPVYLDEVVIVGAMNMQGNEVDELIIRFFPDVVSGIAIEKYRISYIPSSVTVNEGLVH